METRISKTIRWNCYKVAASLPLMPIASVLGVEEALKRKKYIKIEGRQLASIIRHEKDDKEVFLFEFGCVTAVNFTSEDNGRLMDFLKSINSSVSSSLLTCYHQAYYIELNELGMYRPFQKNQTELNYDDYVVSVIAAALAKNTALFSLENEMNNLLDKSEGIIERLKRAKLNINVLKYGREIAAMLRFQYNSAYSARVFDRVDSAKVSHSAKKLYDGFMQEYSFVERLNVVRKKTDELRRIFDMYSALSQSWKENRLLYLEIFLLALFTLPYFFGL